jgi:hypothetical protein
MKYQKILETNNRQVNTQSYKGQVYQQYEQDPYNASQNFLYKRAMFGLSVYTQEELSKMPEPKKKRIERVHKKCQHVLNIWKQEISIGWTNEMFRHYFGEHPALKIFFDNTETDPKFVNKLSFKDLNITKDKIVNKLCESGILPPNFYSIQ